MVKGLIRKSQKASIVWMLIYAQPNPCAAPEW
jgi:hypothetical protein